MQDTEDGRKRLRSVHGVFPSVSGTGGCRSMHCINSTRRGKEADAVISASQAGDIQDKFMTGDKVGAHRAQARRGRRVLSEVLPEDKAGICGGRKGRRAKSS